MRCISISSNTGETSVCSAICSVCRGRMEACRPSRPSRGCRIRISHRTARRSPPFRAVHVLASEAHARAATPAWRPDGNAVVVAVAPRDEPFNLFEYPIDGSARRQLTDVTGGATSPDVSPDGRTIVFVGYTPDGYDL